MKNLILFLVIVLFTTNKISAQRVEIWSNQIFQIDTLSAKLSYPWEITYGPDDSLWVTEARNYRVVKIHPHTGGKRTVLNLANKKNFSRPDKSGGQWPQGGLMGLAIHPQFLSGKPYVYLSYVFRFDKCQSGNNGCFFNTRIVRYEYNFTNGQLEGETIMLDSLPGSNDHNSGRMTIGPDMKLYYTIGDMGAGQFNNANRPNNAQVLHIYEGKILRLNLEHDNDPADPTDKYNGWIPNDNPFTYYGKKLATYSYGHRNAQGIVWGKRNGVDILYSSEHGDKSDDEVNIIQAGGNYGWPKVAGFCDDNYSTQDPYPNNNKLANQNITNETNFCNANNVIEPMFGLFKAPASQIPADGSNIFTWPTIAPSSIDYYDKYGIPGWNNSLLIPSLKYGLYRLKLRNDGMAVDSSSTADPVDTIPYFHGYRVRDIAINPTGDTLYLAIDSTGNTSGPTGGFNGGGVINTQDGGNILRVVYMSTLSIQDHQPVRRAINKSDIKIYPNPASQVVYVETPRGLHKPLKVQMLDMAGRIVLHESTSRDNFSIDVSRMKKGVYVLRIFSGYEGLVKSEKIIIQ